MWTGHSEDEYRKRRWLLVFLLPAVLCGVAQAQGQTPGPSDPDDDPNLSCLYNTTGRVWTDRQTVPLGESVKVSWSVQVPYNCTTVTQTLNSQPVARNGNMIVWPPANASFVLKARFSGASRILSSASVAVGLPIVNGRPTVSITSNDPVRYGRCAIIMMSVLR